MIRPLSSACAALALIAPPATAATYSAHDVSGPAIAGNSVLWGDHLPDGSSVLKRDGQIVATVPAPTPDEGLTARAIGAVAASPSRIAYTVADFREEGDAG